MLADTELNINGTSFKGVYVAILLSLATTLGGGVWTASSLYGRLEAVEGILVPLVGSVVPFAPVRDSKVRGARSPRKGRPCRASYEPAPVLTVISTI